MSYYETARGQRLDLSTLSEREKELLSWLKTEYTEAEDWASFQQKTVPRIIHECTAIRGTWKEHPLFCIQRDMVANIGISRGELSGKNSKMFVD